MRDVCGGWRAQSLQSGTGRLKEGEGRLGLLYSDTWRWEYARAAGEKPPKTVKTVSTSLATPKALTL